MKSRGMVGLVAFLLATVATAALFFYVHGIKRQAESGGGSVTVIVSKQDIPTGTDLDTLISSGAFTQTSIEEKDQVQGAVTSLEQLKGRRTAVPILAGEQIPIARLQGSTELPGGALGIPSGFQAMTVQLETQRIVGGVVHAGDHVAIYGSFQPPVSPNVTVTLVPDVKVLRVTRPSTVDQASSQGTIMMLALRPADTERVVF